mgnify:FL=1
MFRTRAASCAEFRSPAIDRTDDEDASEPVLSVIIPTLNEARRIGARLEDLKAADIAAEIIVADGGSADATIDIAAEASARTIVGPPGRGQQLAAGANISNGSWLLFLHADTQPGPGWATVAKRFMADHDNKFRAGYFRYALDDSAAAARRLEMIVDWRCRLLNLPYGDQGLLISASYYERLGGFRPIALMEDVDLVRKIPRHRLIELAAIAVTSAERYRHEGYLTRPARNLICLALYYLGFPPGDLADFYRSGRL